MVHVRYYMDIVECGKLVAFCKVFQHHSPTFPFIPYHLTPSLIILHHSTSFPIILQHSPLFSLFLQHSTNRHYFSTIFFDNIFFRQHSPTFDKIIFRQEIFVICCQIKNLSISWMIPPNPLGLIALKTYPQPLVTLNKIGLFIVSWQSL